MNYLRYWHRKFLALDRSKHKPFAPPGKYGVLSPFNTLHGQKLPHLAKCAKRRRFHVRLLHNRTLYWRLHPQYNSDS
jgi:hypothetical protein